MSGTKKPNFKGKEAFLMQLEQKAKELGCYGPVANLPPSLDENTHLSLEQILWLQIACSSPDSIGLTLELGADPNFVHKGISLMQLAKAYEREEVVDLLKKYGATATPRKRNLNPSKK